MKRKDVVCGKCGGKGNLHGSDHTNEYGPWFVSCSDCGDESLMWSTTRKAWKNWSLMNGGK